MTVLGMHACKCANCFVSCRSGIPSQNPRGRGTAHSLIWSKMCAAEQGLVLRVFSIKHVIQFYFLASWTREIILEKKPLKECNGSREAVYIQTRYYFVSFAKKMQTNKQTNKQKERWQGHRNSCGQLQWARILIYIYKTWNIKKHSDTRITTAIYNKLLDETRDEHYYILNR